MAKRSQQQIQEENRRKLQKKIATVSKINNHLLSVNQINPEDFRKVNSFINDFLKCETVYKFLYPEMKKENGEKIDVRRLTFNVQKFESALRYYGIEYNHEKMNMMFGSRNSYLELRDRIIHGLKIDCINKVIDRYDEMHTNMAELLQNVQQASPHV